MTELIFIVIFFLNGEVSVCLKDKLISKTDNPD